MARALFATFGLFLFVCAIPQQALARCEANEKIVRLATIAGATDTPQAELAKELQTEFQRSLNGKWCIAFVDPKEGEGGRSALEKLRSNTADLALITLDDLSFAAPLHRVFEVPFAFRDMIVVRKFLADNASQTLRQWQADGLRSLALVPFGLEQIGGSKPLLLPRDAAGIRFGLAANQATRPMISRLRATSQVVAPKDIKQAVEAQAVTAQMARWDRLVKSGTAEKFTAFTRSNHALVGAQIVAASRWLGAQSAADVATLTRSINKAVNLFETRQRTRENRAMEKIMRAGKPVYMLTRQQTRQWREALAPVLRNYAALEGAQAILNAIEAAHVLP